MQLQKSTNRVHTFFPWKYSLVPERRRYSGAPLIWMKETDNLVMPRRVHNMICACTRAGVIYSLVWSNVCVFVACIMYKCICISRLIKRDGKCRYIMYSSFALSHSFVGTQQLSVLFASIRIHTRHWTEWVRSHLFYELTPAAPTPLHQYTHIQKDHRAQFQLVCQMWKILGNTRLSVDFLHSLYARLFEQCREMVLLEVINLELNLACTDVRVCMLVWLAQTEIRSRARRWNFTRWICLTNDVTSGA
jgi:hypothetical protein